VIDASPAGRTATAVPLLLAAGLVTLVATRAWSVDAEPDPRSMRRTRVVEVFEATRDAVVNISATRILEERSRFGDLFDEIFPRQLVPRRRYRIQSAGSGFVIHKAGYIITNAHVVARTQDPKVIFADKREYDARLIAADQDHDLAVLKIEADKPLPHLKLGRSDDLMVGETVIAIGNPFGYENTVTAGIISALDRQLVFAGDQGEVTYRGLIQTDAAINPGNSGGPLLNVLGELVGINSAIRGDAENMGFAIPVNQLRALLPNILSPEQLHRVQVGMRVRGQSKALVVEVLADSPAAEAQVRPGDHLLTIDQTRLADALDFYFEMLDKRAGQTVAIELMRDGEKRIAQLELRPVPKPDGAALARRRIGITLDELAPSDAARLGLGTEGALVISEVERGSPADRADMYRGDVLWQLGSYRVSNLDEVGQILKDTQSGDVIYIRIVRLSGIAHFLRGTIKLR